MKRLLWVLLLSSGLVSAAVGQCVNEENAPTRSRDRQLLSPQGKAVRADITVFDRDRKVVLRTQSKKDGEFSLGQIDSGEYFVQVDAAGFDRFRYKVSPSGEPRRILKLLPHGASGCNDMVVSQDDSPQKAKEHKQ